MKHIFLSWLMLYTAILPALSLTKCYDAAQLSSARVTSLCQDHQGYVWIGTEYGLNKFDGVHFTQYYNDDTNPRSLADDIVRQLMVDSRGTLWIVSNTAVQRYDRPTDAFATVTFEGRPAINANDVLEAPDGSIWVLSATGGVYRLDGSSLTGEALTSVNTHLRQGQVLDVMCLDSRQRLWISYQDKVLQMIDLTTDTTRLYRADALHGSRAVDVIEDESHHLLVLTYEALLQLDEASSTLQPVITYPRMDIRRCCAIREGIVYVATSGNGLWKINLAEPSCSQVTPAKLGDADLREEKISAFLSDRGGNQWIGSSQHGLLFVSSRLEPFTFLPLSRIETNNGNALRALHADPQGRVYVCQEKGGIVAINRDGRALSRWMDGITVLDVFQSRQGSLWAGTYRNGLYRINPQTGEEEWIAATGTQRISSITQDASGNLYTAVFNDGLHSYTPDGKTERTLGHGRLSLTNPFLNTLFTDRSGLIWIGHYYGIDVYNPQTDTLVNVNVPETLRPAIVYAIGQSHEGSIWVGSSKGLFQYYTQGPEQGQWKRFTEKDGLPNNIVCSLEITTDGTIWMGTYRGLGQIETDGKFTRYYRGNGLEQWSYLRGVSTQSSYGEVILGNEDGITYFVPDNIEKDEFEQGITLTGMTLGNQDVNVNTLSGGSPIMNNSPEQASQINVSYTDNTFSLRFSSMDFRDAQNVHYEYRFEDEPKDGWHQTASGESVIFFTHLSVGSHQLVVRAYDNGVYSPLKKLTLRISPPWYRSWWAYLLYLVALILVGILWWRNYWNHQRAEVNEEKIKFFVDISHELRSPLTLIKSPLDKLLKSNHDPSTQRALNNMQRNTNRLLTLVNQILSIRKIEKGQMTLYYAETPLAEFIGNICKDFDYQAEKRHLSLKFDNQAGDLKAWIDRDHFDKVVSNLISNAVKYVEDGGEIDVIVRKTRENQAELVVRDNGPGIDEEKLKRVFERFYQASARPASGQMSYGIGLNLAQKIVMLHKGSITARNRSDRQGSEFIVRLPLGSSHLPSEQLVNDDFFTSPVAEEGSQHPKTEAEPRHRTRKKTTYHVAVVDDDAEIRTFLQTELGDIYHIHTYSNGLSALEGITDGLPDLVVSDVVMPEMDGLELLKRLKSSTRTSHIPVILLTTKTEHSNRVEGLDQGADAYVDKPFNLEELEARISNLIANRLRLKGKFSGMQEQEETVRKVELKGNDAALMEKIMKAVNARLDDSDFNVEALAEEVGLSRVQLHRKMKELTGLTVGDFIRNLRLQQAAELLAKGDITVAQVTYAVGFANPTHFTTAFKKHFGVTPSEYMAKHQMKE